MGACASHTSGGKLPVPEESSRPGHRGILRNALKGLCLCSKADLGTANVPSARPSSETPFGCLHSFPTAEPLSLQLVFVWLRDDGRQEALPGKPVALNPLVAGHQTVADLAKWTRQELEQQHGARFELHSLCLPGIDTIYRSSPPASPGAAASHASCCISNSSSNSNRSFCSRNEVAEGKGSSSTALSHADDDSAYATLPICQLLSTAMEASAAASAPASSAVTAQPHCTPPGKDTDAAAIRVSAPESHTVVLRALVVEPAHVWLQLLGNAEGPCPLKLRLGAAPLDDPRATVADLVSTAIAVWRSKYGKVTATEPITTLLAAGTRDGCSLLPQTQGSGHTKQQSQAAAQAQAQAGGQARNQLKPLPSPQTHPRSLSASAEDDYDPLLPPPTSPPLPPVVLRGTDRLGAVLRSGDLVLVDGVTCSGCRLYMTMAPPFVGCLLDEDVRLDLEAFC